MKRSIANIIEEAKGKMSAFVALVNYKYMNLCIEAEPASLLCITVESGGIKYDLEDLVGVSIPQADQFALFPNDPSPALVFAICKAVNTSHPEFNAEVKDMDDGDDDEEVENKYILLTMPEVDKNRRDLIIGGVDVLQKACQTKLDSLFQGYVAQATKKLMTANPEELDEAKEYLQDLYDSHKEMLDDFSNNKKTEAEEAYQRYIEKQQQKEAEQQEADEAQGRDKVFSMKMEES